MPTTVNAASFLEKRKYPSPRNFPQLFRRLGLKQIWASTSATGKMDTRLTLTSLNDLRTDIAHEGKVPTGFGLSDFLKRLEQMQRFVAAVDRSVSRHFCTSVVSRSTWNGTMT